MEVEHVFVLDVLKVQQKADGRLDFTSNVSDLFGKGKNQVLQKMVYNFDSHIEIFSRFGYHRRSRKGSGHRVLAKRGMPMCGDACF